MPEAARRSLLIVEDDAGLQKQMRWCFDDTTQILVASDADTAMTELRRTQPQVVTLDLGLPPDPGGAEEGFALLRRIAALTPSTKVIVITGREETENAVRAIGMGAYDFYQKPVEADTLKFVVERAFWIAELEAENERLHLGSGSAPLDGVLGSSDRMLKLCRDVEKVAPTHVTALVSGETGTGKELIAKALHRLSPRAPKPFIAINCAAIPEHLLESELFGYEKGAFTGAAAQKRGKIEHAAGGTLFLDEIGDMPLPLQSKLLRFVQERCIERVGGHDPISVDLRLVCATHRDLGEMIRAGDFREDLYYRVSEITMEIPPIREREGDGLLIASALLKRFATDNGMPRMWFTEDARDAIEQWRWPGNVREMENRIKRAVILCDRNQVSADDLQLEAPEAGERQPLNLREVRQEAEKQALIRALNATEQNISQTARLLGVTRPTVYELMSRFALATPQGSKETANDER